MFTRDVSLNQYEIRRINKELEGAHGILGI